ncbi:MAG: hypothetical protein GY865_02335 [candidate division Zixibacteria bacterium]|nr:hypothetical protein [candidate division Zixibacteria bacterium]
MKKMSIPDKLFLLITGHLAGIQIVNGIDGYPAQVIAYFTVVFGILLLASIFLILFGFEILNYSLVVKIFTFLPLIFSAALVATHYPDLQLPYLAFVLAGLMIILFSKYFTNKILTTIIMTTVHGIAGIIIFILPIWLSLTGAVLPIYALVGVGGALIGVGGLLLFFLKKSRAILSRNLIYSFLPVLLLLMTIAFMVGLSAG